VICAFLAGTATAAYTIFDKYAVSMYLISPILVQYFINIGRLAVLTPFALRDWDQIHRQWRQHRRQVIGVAILAPLSYILVLTALVFSPVSYVAPAREISILIGTFMGTRLLAEGHAVRRLIGAAVMMLGLTALAVG
jgi:drug/metabolite transporter (DMT)-like permease